MNLFKNKQKTAVFEVHRFEDAKGISGTGHVMDGVVFPDGTTIIRWRSKDRSTAIFNTYRQFERIHLSKHGASEVRWVKGFNGLEFAYNYLNSVVGKLDEAYRTSTVENKYMIARIKQIMAVKISELRSLRDDEEISISQNSGASQTSLSDTGISAESFTRPPESDVLSPEEEGEEVREAVSTS